MRDCKAMLGSWRQICLIAGLALVISTVPAAAQPGGGGGGAGAGGGGGGPGGGGGGGKSGGGGGPSSGGGASSGGAGSSANTPNLSSYPFNTNFNTSGGNSSAGGSSSGSSGGAAVTSVGTTSSLSTTATSVSGATLPTNKANASQNATPGINNPFQTYYASPLAVGTMLNTTTTQTSSFSSTPSFGQPIYPATTAPTGAKALTNLNGAFNTFNQYRAPAYRTALGADLRGEPIVAPKGVPSAAIMRAKVPASQLVAELQAVIARSSNVKGKEKIRVEAEGTVVVLRGQVPSPAARRLAESLIRMTPGVGDVRNEILVQAPPPPTPQPGGE